MATVPELQRPASLAASTVGIARRSLLKFLRTPRLALIGTVQGAMFLLIFRYVFGGAIDAGGLSYVDFLVPGFVTAGVLFGAIGAATGMAEDLDRGFVDRLRSLPIPRSAVLAGRALATRPCRSGAWPSPWPSASPSASASTARSEGP
ncbi:MAG TPA: ABC transporter permease [Actinomycetota bacterium]|nr:ABC transporter permease [Actinomycetota bacterium]